MPRLPRDWRARVLGLGSSRGILFALLVFVFVKCYGVLFILLIYLLVDLFVYIYSFFVCYLFALYTDWLTSRLFYSIVCFLLRESDQWQQQREQKKIKDKKRPNQDDGLQILNVKISKITEKVPCNLFFPLFRLLLTFCSENLWSLAVFSSIITQNCLSVYCCLSNCTEALKTDKINLLQPP